MMVVLSGYLSAKSYNGNLKAYYKKRFLRLVLPTWIFVVGYNCFLLLFGVDISLERWLKCFLLTRDGMGYIWIILVYFECVLLTPLFHLLLSKAEKVKSGVMWIYIGFVISIVGYEILCKHGVIDNYAVLYYTIGYMVPYGFAYYLGMRLSRGEQNKEIIKVALGSGILYVIQAVALLLDEGGYITTNTYKYPARIYYLSFGLCLAFLIIGLLKKVSKEDTGNGFNYIY